MPACTCVDLMHPIQRQEADPHEVNRDRCSETGLRSGLWLEADWLGSGCIYT